MFWVAHMNVVCSICGIRLPRIRSLTTITIRLIESTALQVLRAHTWVERLLRTLVTQK